MGLREIHPTGLEFLDVCTRLLQDSRLADPRGGLWEAADLQWWWRLDQRADETAQCFWMDGSNPVVGAAFTRWPERYGCDLLGTAADLAEHRDAVWAFVMGWIGDRGVDMMIGDGDVAQIAAAEAAGFRVSDWADRTAWLPAARRPAAPRLPPGYTLGSYDGGAHPMAARNGAAITDRLHECSLYRADLDLAIRDGDGNVAGYALFWADDITGVGLVEPMRVEAEHQGRGLARVLLAAGLDALAAAGCTRLKVSFKPTNAPAARLYTGAGFEVTSSTRNYTLN